MGRLIHGLAEEGRVRVMAADTTDIVAEAVRRHETSPTASAALGRVLTGTPLLGASFKDFDRLTVKIEAEVTSEGSLRKPIPTETCGAMQATPRRKHHQEKAGSST